jgi:tetratricopeptide (TPR) repeat protein
MGRFAFNWILCFVVFLVGVTSRSLAQSGEYDQELKKGTEAFQRGDLKEAEKHFRAAIKAQPNSWEGHSRVADTLFFRARFSDAVPEYEKARELAGSGQITPGDLRHLNDQLGVANIVSGNLDKAIEVYQSAISKDPDYLPYYYNLACTFAAKGDLDQALTALREAYARRDKWPQGQTFPSPRKDASFKRYVGDEKFEKAGKELGF